MKTKGFLFCLLFLMLGTTTALADKYYRAMYSAGTKYRVDSIVQGKEYMIFNTAHNPTNHEDRTGFLYSDGYKLQLRKYRDQDVHIYNECFIFTPESVEEKTVELTDSTDSKNPKQKTFTYYKVLLKTKNNSTYVDVWGNTSESDRASAKYLYIYPFDAARYGDSYNRNESDWSKVLTENNTIKQATVYSESADYAKVYPHDVTSANKVFIISDKDIAEGMTGANYWNGNKETFAYYGEGHPFAFYQVEEVTWDNELNVQDLHIYSRCDLYSAQKIYGYVQDASKIKSFPTTDAVNHPNGYTGEGGFNYLIDGNQYTYNITDWHSNDSNTPHYYQIDLGKSVSELRLYMKKRPNGDHAPTKVEVWVSETEDGTYEKAGEATTKLLDSYESITDAIPLGGNYRYIRIYAPERSKSEQCIALSELYVLPNIKLIEDAKDYLDSSLPVSATAADYQKLISRYNAEAPDVRLLSGVPLPGNKYRIYADTYSGGAYVSRELCTDGTTLTIGDTYLDLADEAEKDKYEWICEPTPDGKLVFRSVVDNTKYLSNAGVTTDIEEAKWTISTNETHHHGVPLKNRHGQYLTINNTGDTWMGDVKSPQDQTAAFSYTNDKGNDDPDDDETVTLPGGVCTDFVFLPVDVDANEIRVTINANDLVKRNSTLTFNGATYTMPFSRILTEDGTMPELTLHCTDDSLHTFAKATVNGTEDNTVVTRNENVLEFSFTKAAHDNAYVEVLLDIKAPFEHSDATTKKLYRMKDMLPVGAGQKVAPQRADVPIGGGGGQVSTARYNYAKFDTKSTNMTLIDESVTSAEAFFYFTTDDTQDGEFKRSFIHSAVTTMKFATVNEWNEAGRGYYVLPNATTDEYVGYNISQVLLNDVNNPSSISADFTSSTVVMNPAENNASVWMFEEVDETTAKTALKDYIKDKIDEINTVILDARGVFGNDADKVTTYEGYVEDIYEVTVGDGADPTITLLVEKAQELHMIDHEIHYSLQALPKVSDETLMDKAAGFANPKWYYARNVKSIDHYATYNGAESLMKLQKRNDEKSDMTLSNLFYIAGDIKEEPVADNRDIVDKYFEGHIHNFMAMNDTTLLGLNEVVFENITFNGSGGTSAEHVHTRETLDSDSWEITAEFTSNGTNANHYGTALLVANSEGNPNGNSFPNGFQIYLTSEGYVILKAADISTDQYAFKHTQGANSYIKVVVTCNQKRLQVTVTNSLGQELSIDDTEHRYNNSKNYNDYIYCPNIKPVTCLASFFPGAGVTLKSLKGENVLAMKWDKHDKDNLNKDKWFILPSSNTQYPGLAVVMDGPDDRNMGWTNVDAENDEIFTNLGSNDNSTWQFERVQDFDVHLNELIAMYNLDDVVIYNKELVELYNIIEKGKTIIYDDNYNGRPEEEAAFNEVYFALKNYKGPKPEELKAPKPGKFYTIHHVPHLMTNDMAVNEFNVVKVGTDINNGDEYDSRGVWYFEGTEQADGFLALDGSLRLKSLHTQSSPYAAGFTIDSLTLSDKESAAVTIEKIRAAEVRLNVNGGNLTTANYWANSVQMTDYIIYNTEVLPERSYVGMDFYHKDGAASTVEAIATDYSNVEIPGVTVQGFVGGVAIETYLNSGAIKDGDILCPNVNGNTSPDIEFIITYTGLSANCLYNNIALDLHALNKDGNYQSPTDGVDRQWNVTVLVKNETGDEFSEDGELENIDIAKNITGAHKVWNIPIAAKSDKYGNLTLKIKVTKGTANEGCYFGLSGVAISGNNNRHDTWYIEEVADPTKIYHETTTAAHGHATLMLGFNSKIPTGVDAFYAKTHGDIRNDRYISMTSIGEPGEDNRILPANTAVMICNHNSEAVAKTHKFYYSAADVAPIAEKNDNYVHGVLWNTIVDCSSFDETDFDGDGLADGDVNIYMLLDNKPAAKLYWIYEERSEDGTIKPGNANSDKGGYILCKANRCFMVLPKIVAANVSSFSLRLGGGETTAIENVDDAPRVEIIETIYDLQGRKLEEITQPGIYIINGKKVFIK